jgi:hypothetical protein
MRGLFGLIVLLLAIVVGVGFYQGWFHFSTGSTGNESSATISVDRDKIRADEGKAKEKLEEYGQKAKEKTGERTGEAKEPERRP